MAILKYEDIDPNKIYVNINTGLKMSGMELRKKDGISTSWIPIDDVEGIARKFDKGKPRYSLVPYKEFREVVEILTFGAEKYEDDNWKRVEGARARYFDALERHIAQYKIAIEESKFEDKFDEESKKNHLAHAICNCLFLMWFDNKDKLTYEAKMEAEDG